MTDRIVPYVVLPLIAAAASLLNLVHFGLVNMFRPAWPPATTLAWYAAFVVIVAGVVVAFRQVDTGRRTVLIAALALVIAAGFLPRAVDAFVMPPVVVAGVEEEEAPAEAPEAGTPEVSEPVAPAPVRPAFVFPADDWRADVAARAEAGAPYTAGEGFELLDYAAGADLSNEALAEHAPEAFALVEAALAADVLDPDALTTVSAVADSPAVTLTLLWYERRIAPGAPTAVDRQAWQLLEMMVAAGADIAGDDAAQLRADLAKSVIAGEGRFIGLDWGEPEPIPATVPAEDDDAEATGAD